LIKRLPRGLSTHLPRISDPHVTLGFVGKKNDTQGMDAEFLPDEGKPCRVVVTGVGQSHEAMAFKVKSVELVEGEGALRPLRHFQDKGVLLHVTLAKAEGFAAKDSWRVLDGAHEHQGQGQGQGQGRRYEHFRKELVLEGVLRRVV
jgi:hypothetical protein